MNKANTRLIICFIELTVNGTRSVVTETKGVDFSPVGLKSTIGGMKELFAQRYRIISAMVHVFNRHVLGKAGRRYFLEFLAELLRTYTDD